tara:strand:- start:8374 stop:9120 length:747 start_codon:yes stop_codon:yes gene_type:complete
MKSYIVSVISYLNSAPYLYGLDHFSFTNKINLILDYPSKCSSNLVNRVSDISLAPVVTLNSMPNISVINNYGIAADGSVDTVCLYSHVPIENIKNILLDYQSNTSVELLKILCREYWEINPFFIKSKPGFEDGIIDKTAGLIIGDRAFSSNNIYPFVYDLSETWKKMTGLPFVFACWMSGTAICSGFIEEFNNAIDYGLNNIDNAISNYSKYFPKYINSYDYLNNKIYYNLNESMLYGMNLFLSKIKK